MLPALCRRPMVTLCLLLSACGGGGDTPADPGAAAGTCSVAEQNSWLATTFDEWYFWYRQAPRPDPAGHASVAAYFAARLYAGSDAAFPADRWSYSQSTADHNRTFGEGASLGWGLAVAALEAAGQAGQPLWVRYVEPQSPAAAQGVQRGDEVLALNGRSAASLVTDSAALATALTAAQVGDTLTVRLRRGGVERTLVLGAVVFNFIPVPGVAQHITAGGRKLGVLQVQQMISQALTPLDTAFAQFRAAGINDLVLDLRYNGGGLVSTGATLASYIAGTRGAGLAYARLLFNDKQGASNSSFSFSQPAQALSMPRVFVLAGPRTCSASEQVIAGLRGVGIEVVLVGDTTCGKPVGFLAAQNCGRTYSIVNFESVNQRGEGRYFDGLPATCAVDENFTTVQNGDADPLLAAASVYADHGACPRAAPLRAGGVRRHSAADGGERQGMFVR